MVLSYYNYDMSTFNTSMFQSIKDALASSDSKGSATFNEIMPTKVGNTYISYQKMEPFNTILGMVANVMNYQHVLGEDLRDDFLNKAIFMGSAVIVDKSMLAGVSDLAEVFNAQTGSGTLGRTFAKFARAQFFPYAGLSAQLGSIIDANQKEANTVWETIFQRDVFAKKFLAPKYDILSKD